MKHIITVLSLLFCLIILPKKSDAKYCALHFTYSFMATADYYDIYYDYTISTIPVDLYYSRMEFFTDGGWFLSINPSTDLSIVVGNHPGHFIFSVPPYFDPISVLVDTLVVGKTYSEILSVYDVPGQDLNYFPFATSEVSCQLSMAVTFSIQYYDEPKFESYLCEGSNIPINNSLVSFTEFVHDHYISHDVEKQPLLYVSSVDDPETWKLISKNDLIFSAYEKFIETNFPGKSIFTHQFQMKIKFALCETAPVIIPKFYHNYPLDDKKLSVVDNFLYIGKNNVATGGKFSLWSDFYPSTRVGEQKLNSQYFAPEDGKYILPLHGPYTITFKADDMCPVSRYVFVPDVEFNKVNESENVFWYDGEIRDAVSLVFNYFEGEGDNYLFKDITPNEGANTIISYSDNDQPENSSISVLDRYDFNKTTTKTCKKKTAILTTDASLTTLTVNVTGANKKFIPITINLDKKLKAYPKITATLDNIDPPICNGDDVVVKLSDVKNGLGGSYDFVVKFGDNPQVKIPDVENENGVWSVSIKKQTEHTNSLLENYSLSIFDSNVLSEDSGRDHRSQSFSFTVKRPQKLEIKEYSFTNLRCYQDKSGSIEITKVNRSYEDEQVSYHWYIYPNTEIDQEIKKVDSNPIIDGLSKNDYVVKITNNECEFMSDIISIDEPPELHFTNISPKKALCYNYSDGSIFTSVDGGTKYANKSDVYCYSWNVGAISKDLFNVPAGKYQLIVRDAHECEASTGWIEVSQPPELINTLTPSYTLCQGSELRIDDGNQKPEQFTHGYEWHLPDNTIIQDRIITIKPDMPQGIYVLKSKDEHCFTYDTTLITFFDNNLPIRFLVPTESYINDTLVIAEDSDNQPDYTWTFAYNPDMFTDITDEMSRNNVSQNLTFLSIDKAGNDIITMYADNGFCKASLSKEVTISPHFRPEYVDYDVDEAGMFSRLQIGPNPNNGEFTLFANLTQESPISLTLYDVSRSRKIPLDYSAYKTLSTHYAIPFRNLGLQTGIYTLLISANGETKQIKFAVE